MKAQDPTKAAFVRANLGSIAIYVFVTVPAFFFGLGFLAEYGLAGVPLVAVGVASIALILRFQISAERIAELRRLRYCYRCGYDLRSLPSDRCPECGTVALKTGAA